MENVISKAPIIISHAGGWLLQTGVNDLHELLKNICTYYMHIYCRFFASEMTGKTYESDNRALRLVLRIRSLAPEGILDSGITLSVIL